MKRRLPALLCLLLLAGCRITPEMSDCEKAGVISLGVLGVLLLVGVAVGLLALEVIGSTKA